MRLPTAIKRFLALTVASCLALAGAGCGGGAVAPPPAQSIVLKDGTVKYEQVANELVVKPNDSRLPGVGFSAEVVEVSLYEGDAFADPRTDTPSPTKLLRTFRVDRDGTLLDELRLNQGVYTAVAENIHVVQDGKEFRSELTAYVFEVFAVGATLQTTLPVKFEAQFPAIGSVIENSYVAFLTDEGAAGGNSYLFLQHANGTVDMKESFVWQTEEGKPVAAVSFDAWPGGPRLGNVQRLILKAFQR